MKLELLRLMLKARLATRKPKQPAGFSLVEVILSSAVFILLVTALTGAYLYGQEATVLAGNRARAVMLAEEGLEGGRNIRDAAFANIVPGTFGLTTTSNQYNLTGASDTTGIFTRDITVASVSTNRRSLTSNISWQQNAQRSGAVTFVTYLTNWQRAGGSSWSSTTLAASLDLTGNNDGTRVQVVGNYAYLLRDSGSANLVIINISDPAAPTVVGTASLSGTPFNIFVSGNYAYIASNENSQELQIVNITNKSAPVLVGFYNVSGNSDARSIFVSGSTAYLGLTSGGDTEFFIINVTAPNSPQLIGSLNIDKTANELVVIGNYAYLATNDNSQELQVINISNPAVPTVAGFLDLTSNTDATTIANSGNTLYIGQGTNLRIINVSTPTAPVLLGSLVVTGTINEISTNLASSETALFLATTDQNGELKVINVTAPAAPTVLTQLNLTGNNGLRGVFYDPGSDRVYAGGLANTAEFLVIAPQ